jgi:ribosome maturation factor RimP
MSKIDLEALGGIVERVAAREEVELVHWELVGPPGRSLLRIYIDKPAGVSLDDCEAVSKQVGLLLDVEDLIPSRYTLEVSSPGLERGLYKQADFLRFTGQRIRLKSLRSINGQRNFRGRLEGIDGNRVHLLDDTAGSIEIPYEDVLRANLEFEFSSVKNAGKSGERN